MTWVLLQKKKGVPCFRVGLALQHAEVLEEELHALAGLLHNGAVDTGHARLQCHHPTLKGRSCIAFAYAAGTCSCSGYMHMQQVCLHVTGRLYGIAMHTLTVEPTCK